MSLLAFCVVWVGQLHKLIYAHFLTIGGVVIIAIGLCCDLCGETILISWATRPDLSVGEFATATRLYQLLSAGVANGSYCAGGLALSLVSWHVGWLRGAAGVVGLAMWAVGFGLTIATIFASRWGMVVTGAGVMMLFIPWATIAGWRLRPARS